MSLRFGFLARRAFVVLVTGAALGCSDGIGPLENVSGRYQLLTVSGKNVPTVVHEEPGWTRHMTSGYIEFDANSEFQVQFLFRDVEFGSETTFEETDAGLWTQTGTRVAMTFPGGFTLGATVGDATVTLDAVPAGYIYAFRR